MICDKEADASRDALEALDANPDANGSDKKHHALYTCPIDRVRVTSDQGIDEQRRPDNQDVGRQEDANEKSPEHGRPKTLSNPAPPVKQNMEFEPYR
jgi:hypothetical protein